MCPFVGLRWRAREGRNRVHGAANETQFRPVPVDGPSCLKGCRWLLGWHNVLCQAPSLHLLRQSHSRTGRIVELGARGNGYKLLTVLDGFLLNAGCDVGDGKRIQLDGDRLQCENLEFGSGLGV